MPEDVIHLEGEPARALAALLQQTLSEGANAVSESVQAFRAAVEANTQATGNLQQAFDSFRSQQQAKLDEALARVESEVAARVQAESDRDAIKAVIEEARTAIEADTAQETELLSAVTANTPAAPSAPEPTPAEPPVDTAPAEPVPDAPVVVEPPVTEPAAPVDAAPVAEGEPAPVVTPPADDAAPAPAV